MARPTVRVLALLEILQAGGTRTVGELATRLEVDGRTVRRYVEHLRELDVPVRSVRGRHGGYRLARGHRMPPLMLTDEEAVAVLLGLVASRRVAPTDASATAAESAAAKLRRVLPEALGRRLDALADTVAFTEPARVAAASEARVLLLLAEAARVRRPVAFGYTDRHGQATERTLHPYGIVAHRGRWYATGEDPARGIRTFRLDRIVAPALRTGSFTVPDGFDAAAHVVAGLAGTPWRHTVSVRVEGTADEVRSRLSPGLATIEELPGGAARVRLRAERLDWVPPVLAGLDRPFVVEAPEALRDVVRALARRLDDSVAARPRDM